MVRPVPALARGVRRRDESGVDGAVEATGRGTRAARRLVAAGAPGRPAAGRPPRSSAGALLLGVAAVAVAEVWP